MCDVLSFGESGRKGKAKTDKKAMKITLVDAGLQFATFGRVFSESDLLRVAYI